MSTKEARVYNGRYELVRHVARGGMAEVYQAHDLLLDRPVALKVLFPELSVDRSFVERFRREAQAAANLSHQNIVSIFDWGEEDGTYFIVMEFVDGRPLSQLIRTEGPLSPELAANIGGQVAAALGYAHRHGVVHRDIKPGNILLDDHGVVKVTDFGIARAGDPKENLTQTGIVMGTATYFSPEQAQGLGTDARTDLYSLGVVLYEMLTGRAPFTGESPVAIAYKHVKEDPVPPSQLEPSVPAHFEAIVLSAMAKDVDERYPSAEELRGDLMRFARGQTPKAVRVRQALGGAAGAADATTALPATDATLAMASGGAAAGGRAAPVVPPAAVAAEEEKARSGPWLALSGVLLVALLVILFLLARAVGIGTNGTAARLTVPSVVGQTEQQARDSLERLGFQVEVDAGRDRGRPMGTVLAQDPAGGARADRGATVKLTVNSPGDTVPVPSVVNLAREDAQRVLEGEGFRVEVVEERNAQVDEGVVFEQDPGAGIQAEQGSTVTITVSAGSGLPPVPDVVGLDVDDAKRRLEGAGFRTRVVEETSSTAPPGQVVRTDPPAGERLGRGQSTVTLYVAKAPPTTTQAKVVVPNVVGMDEDDARQMLRDRGFVVEVQRATGGTAGKVRAQNPTGGTRADPGSTVVITVSQGSTTSSTSSTTTSTTAATLP